MTTLMEVTPFSTSDISTAVAPITEYLTFGNVAAILALALGSGVVLYVGWVGVRKFISIVRDAFQGKKVHS